MRASGFGLVLALLSVTSCGRTGAIKREDLGDKWPFTVDSGTMTCLAPHELVFEVNGRKYAVNDVAQQRKREKNYYDIYEITRSDPNAGGSKVDINPIIERGLALCGK
jgi:hypothetical protein